MKANELIAEFMEVDQVDIDTWLEDNLDLEYHTSWDWLMPVLKKINLKLTPQNYSEWRMINRPTEYHIKDVYNQVVQFIKWYNQK